MTAFEIIGSILLIITCVLVTLTVLFQSSSKQDGIAALGGKSSAAAAAEAKIPVPHNKRGKISEKTLENGTIR